MAAKKPKYTEGITLPPQIKIESVVAMKNILKTHSLDWAKDLAELMYPQTDAQKKKDPTNEKGTSRVYNIIADQIKNNGARVLFINTAKKLLDKYEASHQDAMKIVDELQLSTQ